MCRGALSLRLLCALRPICVRVRASLLSPVNALRRWHFKPFPSGSVSKVDYSTFYFWYHPMNSSLFMSLTEIIGREDTVGATAGAGHGSR
jgi:hypothetical protein